MKTDTPTLDDIQERITIIMQQRDMLLEAASLGLDGNHGDEIIAILKKVAEMEGEL